MFYLILAAFYIGFALTGIVLTACFGFSHVGVTGMLTALAMTPEFVAIPIVVDRPQPSEKNAIPRFMIAIQTPARTLLAAAVLGAILSVASFIFWSIFRPTMTSDVTKIATCAVTFLIAIILALGLILLWANVKDAAENAG